MRIKILLMLFICLLLAACGNNSGTSGNSAESDSLVAVEIVEEYPEQATSDEPTTDEKNESGSKEASVRKFLLDMYAIVLPVVEKNNGEKYIPKYFGEDLLDWYRMVDKYDQTYNDGEIGCFDCELWTQSQDPDADIKATVESVRFETDYMDNESAIANVRLKGKYNPPTIITVRLVEDGARWVITDYNGIASKMKFYMANHPQ